MRIELSHQAALFLAFRYKPFALHLLYHKASVVYLSYIISPFPKLKEECEQKLTETKKQFEIAKVESKNEFPREAELNEKQKRLAELDALLNIDKKNSEVMDIPDGTPQKPIEYHRV